MNRPGRLVWVIVLAFLLRLATALAFPGNPTDMASYRIVGNLVLAGENPYVLVPERYPYFPGWAMIEAATLFVARVAEVDFGILIRLPSILADVGICVFIYRILQRGEAVTSFDPLTAAFVHAVNPVAIAIVAGHGQFDSLPFLLLVAAIVYSRRERWVRSALVLGLGIAIKPIPVFMGGLFLADRERWLARSKYVALAAVPSALLSLPYLYAAPRAFFDATVGYDSQPHFGWYEAVKSTNSAAEFFGIGAVRLPEAQVLLASKFVLVTAILLVTVWYYRNRDQITLWQATLLVVLVFYAVSASVAPQYLYWATPFLVLVDLPLWYVGGFIVTGFVALVLRYLVWYGFEPLGSLLVGVPAEFAFWGAFYVVNLLFWGTVLVGVWWIGFRALKQSTEAGDTDAVRIT